MTEKPKCRVEQAHPRESQRQGRDRSIQNIIHCTYTVKLHGGVRKMYGK